MGRTVVSFRPAVDREIESWSAFVRGLRPADRDTFTVLADYARVHADAGSLANRPLLSEFLFMAVALEQEKAIHSLRAQVTTLEEEVRRLKRDLVHQTESEPHLEG